MLVPLSLDPLCKLLVLTPVVRDEAMAVLAAESKQFLESFRPLFRLERRGVVVALTTTAVAGHGRRRRKACGRTARCDLGGGTSSSSGAAAAAAEVPSEGKHLDEFDCSIVIGWIPWHGEVVAGTTTTKRWLLLLLLLLLLLNFVDRCRFHGKKKTSSSRSSSIIASIIAAAAGDGNRNRCEGIQHVFGIIQNLFQFVHIESIH